MANKKSTKTSAKAKKTEKKNGWIASAKGYLTSVRSEMKRVVWPTKKELVNYTIAVCASLIVVGVVDRKSTRLNSSHMSESRMPSSA